MKLRKALDRAKAEREKEGINRQEEVIGIDRKKSNDGWTPPVYSESRSVKLNRKHVYENRGVCIKCDAPEIDNYKVLRTQLKQRTRETGLNTIMVTSCHKGEGKTVTSMNMAMTFAKEFNQTVLLVDCDLKKQDLHRYMGCTSTNSLIDYLVDERPLNELIVWPEIEKLCLISGDRTVTDSTELLSSPRMRSLVGEMKNRYEDRYIFFDFAPLLRSPDAAAFAPLVDGIIMVVESGRTSLKDIRRALELISNEKFLGFVLNVKK